MTRKRACRWWLRLGLLAVVIGLLPGASPLTQAQSGGSLSYGARVFGTLTADAPHAAYSFPGSAGDVVTAMVDNWTGTLDLSAQLIAPYGAILDASGENTPDDNPFGAYLSAVLPDDGIYLLRIGSENGTAGDFALALAGRAAPSGEQLLFGQGVDVALVPAAEPQLFWFEAEDCPTTLAITSLSAGRPYSYPFVVHVYDQRGQSVALLRGGEEQEAWVTVTPRSGRYEVEVSSDDPNESGAVRLLVTCGMGTPGCPPGAEPIPGVVGTDAEADCPPCITPDNPPDEGGCPDLNFRVEQAPDNPHHATVRWDAMAGASTYVVYMYGRTVDSGYVYLAHRVWVPGDPLAFSWDLPEWYVSVRFVLRVYIGDTIICLEETGLEFETPPPPEGEEPVCPNFPVTVEMIDDVTREVRFTWPAYAGADAYLLQWFRELDDGTIVLDHVQTVDGLTTTVTALLDDPADARSWRLRVYPIVDGIADCNGEGMVEFAEAADDCGPFTLAPHIADPTTREVIWTWDAYPGAVAYAVEWFEVLADGTEALQGSILLDAATTTLHTTLPLPGGPDVWRMRVRAQVDDGFPCEAEASVELTVQLQACVFFALEVTANSGAEATITWPAYPGAEMYAIAVFDAARALVPGWPVLVTAEQHSVDVALPPGTYTVQVAPWTEAEGAYCPQEVPLTLAPTTLTCEVRTTRADVPIRIGPGVGYAIFRYMEANTDFRVIAQVQDGSGARWWQLDPAPIPGGDGVPGGLWVAQDQVEADPICGQMPMVELPEPELIQQVRPPADDEPEGPPPGQWLPCGSCGTCGHPAAECVTAPDGACLWDPATCGITPPEEEEPEGPPGQWLPCGSCSTCGHPASECVTAPDGTCLWDPGTCGIEEPPEEEPPPQQCFTVGAAADPSFASSVTLLTSGNCPGGGSNSFTPGTTVQAQYRPGNCKFHGWTGCTSGTSNPISFTVTASCTIIATFRCS